jgi:hypothetical protein
VQKCLKTITVKDIGKHSDELKPHFGLSDVQTNYVSTLCDFAAKKIYEASEACIDEQFGLLTSLLMRTKVKCWLSDNISRKLKKMKEKFLLRFECVK